MTASVPTGPIEKEPIEVIRGKTGKQLGFLLDDALRGIELGSYDRLIIEWLKGWDQGTVVNRGQPDHPSPCSRGRGGQRSHLLLRL